MSFLDQKEQVIHLVLTKYGKQQIAKGLFNPASYNFVDDDILYDSMKANFDETQNDSEDRIVSETPKNSFLTNVSKLSVSNPKKNPFGKKTEIEEDLFESFLGLTNSSIGEQTAPKYTFFCLQNQLSSSESVKQISGINHFVPQLNFEMNTFLIAEKLSEELAALATAVGSDDLEQISAPELGIDENTKLLATFEDGTGLKLKRGKTIGLVVEENAVQQKDGFEIEFYAVKKNKTVTVNGFTVDLKGFVTQLQYTAGAIEEGSAIIPSLMSVIEFDNEDSLVFTDTGGFSFADGLYDNLPEIEEDFC